MEVDDKDAPGVKISISHEGEPSPKHKLILECSNIALCVLGGLVRKGEIDWGFENRRRLEKKIEDAIAEKLFPETREDAPRVRLVRDGKSKLVSLELKPRERKNWAERTLGKEK